MLGIFNIWNFSVFIRTSFLQYFFCHEAWEFIIHHHHFTLVARKWSWVFSGHFSMLTFPSLGRKPSGTYPMIMLILWNEYGSFPKKTAVIFICLPLMMMVRCSMVLETNSGISQMVKMWKNCTLPVKTTYLDKLGDPHKTAFMKTGT